MLKGDPPPHTPSFCQGCTAPAYDTNQLHAAVVELYAAKDAEIKYSTVQVGAPVWMYYIFLWLLLYPGGSRERSL